MIHQRKIENVVISDKRKGTSESKNGSATFRFPSMYVYEYVCILFTILQNLGQIHKRFSF